MLEEDIVCSGEHAKTNSTHLTLLPFVIHQSMRLAWCELEQNIPRPKCLRTLPPVAVFVCRRREDLQGFDDFYGPMVVTVMLSREHRSHIPVPARPLCFLCMCLHVCARVQVRASDARKTLHVLGVGDTHVDVPSKASVRKCNNNKMKTTHIDHSKKAFPWCIMCELAHA
jgi:hypothetical protein